MIMTLKHVEYSLYLTKFSFVRRSNYINTTIECKLYSIDPTKKCEWTIFSVILEILKNFNKGFKGLTATVMYKSNTTENDSILCGNTKV